MRTLLALLICCSCFALSAQDLKRLDEKNGFKRFKFGMNADSIPGLYQLGEAGLYSINRSSNLDTLKIGDYDITSVFMQSYKGKLYLISYVAKGYANSLGVLSVLEQAYGKGEEQSSYKESYAWDSERIRLYYNYDKISDKAQIIMYDKVMDAAMKAAKKNSEKKAVEDL